MRSPPMGPSPLPRVKVSRSPRGQTSRQEVLVFKPSLLIIRAWCGETCVFRQSCHLPCPFNVYFQAERHICVPPPPVIVDYAVELDNAIYNHRNPTFSAPSADTYLTLMSPEDFAREAWSQANLSDAPGFESFGSSLYTQYALGYPRIPAGVLTPLLVDNGDEDVPQGDASSSDRDSIQPFEEALAPTEALPVSHVTTALSPTPSLSYSAPSTLSSPSPISPIDHDVTEVTTKWDGSLTCNSPLSWFTRPSKRADGRPSALSAKKKRASASPVLSPSTGTVRFPCTVPGCKQVCKTLGDLKRHESVLAHKPPSWECRRCHYQFTREDALKRHAKNMPNCVNAKTRPKGRAASTKPRRPGATEVEANS